MKHGIRFTTLWLALVLGFSLPAQAEAMPDPKAVIESTVTQIITVLEARTDKSKLTEVNREAIRLVITGRFDYAEMSRRTVGRDWAEQSEASQAAFTETFRELMERSYGNRLSEYNGQTIAFENAEYKNDKARVKSFVSDANKTTPVEYRLHQTPTGWQVYDIKIEGVSLVSTFREDFKSILSRDGFEQLLEQLKTKVSKLKDEDHNA